MTKKQNPALTLVGETAATVPAPPRTLGKYDRKLWEKVMAEYDVTDIAGMTMLAEACVILDRAEALRGK